jgi:hypothetical protein
MKLTIWRTSSTGQKVVNNMRGEGVVVHKWPGQITSHGLGYGVSGAVREAWSETLKAGFRWCYADGPYFLRKKADSVRLAWDGQWFVTGPERRVKSLEAKGVILQDRTQAGDTVFVCPSHDLQHRKQDGESAEAWVKRTTKELRKYTDRPIETRTKGASSDLNHRIADMQRVFDRAWAVVTAGSTIGCEAIAAGVPVFTDRACGASPLAHRDLAEIERAQISGDRERWAHNLAARQFDSVELRKGRAWAVMKEDFAFVESR